MTRAEARQRVAIGLCTVYLLGLVPLALSGREWIAWIYLVPVGLLLAGLVVGGITWFGAGVVRLFRKDPEPMTIEKLDALEEESDV